jgi:hypothetical protein
VELELAIDCCPDQKAQKRLNTMHLLLCGASRSRSPASTKPASTINYHPVSGRPRVLTDEVIEAEILPVVDDPNSAGEYHWTVTKQRWPAKRGQ